MELETPPVLARLLATVENERLFDMSGVDNPAAFKKELRGIWAHIYYNAVTQWNDMVEGAVESDDNDVCVAVLTGKYHVLHTCWRGSFLDGLRAVAKKSGDQ